MRLPGRKAAADDPFAALERRLGHRFRRRELLERALTHPSWANEEGSEEHYERLEFLGDSVVGLAAAEWLFESHPELAEGRLSELRSLLVNRRALAAQARRFELGDALRLGVGEARSGGGHKASLLADAMEAVLGAIFLDGGLAAVRSVVEPLFAETLAAAPEALAGGAKSRLQELAQSRGLELPAYRVVEETGPDHAKRFTVECRLPGGLQSVGEGGSKKRAEERAAAILLERLR